MISRTAFLILGGVGIAAGYLLFVRPRLARPAEEKLKDEYDRLPLKAHALLAEVPMHTLGRVHLPGGRGGMNIVEVNEAAGMAEMEKIKVGTTTDLLFRLREIVGRLMRWDDVPDLQNEVTYLSRISDEERSRSLIPPGEKRGINRVIYCFSNELAFEIVNRTVHCFWVQAVARSGGGYDLYNAVYVRRLNWRTPIYMALISPLLDWIIYPAMDRSIRRAWEQRFPDPVQAAEERIRA